MPSGCRLGCSQHACRLATRGPRRPARASDAQRPTRFPSSSSCLSPVRETCKMAQLPVGSRITLRSTTRRFGLVCGRSPSHTGRLRLRDVQRRSVFTRLAAEEARTAGVDVVHEITANVPHVFHAEPACATRPIAPSTAPQSSSRKPLASLRSRPRSHSGSPKRTAYRTQIQGHCVQWFSQPTCVRHCASSAAIDGC
jgi:hypothetical protein